MSYENRITQDQNDNKYKSLKSTASTVSGRTQNWMTDATTLHAATADPAEQAEIVALRDQLIADLRAILGV